MLYLYCGCYPRDTAYGGSGGLKILRSMSEVPSGVRIMYPIGFGLLVAHTPAKDGRFHGPADLVSWNVLT